MDEPETCLGAAIALEDQEGASRAVLAAYQRALHHNPLSADAATNLGLVAKAQGNVRGCAAAHMHAQALQPSLRRTQAARLLPADSPRFAVLDASAARIHASLLRTVLQTCGFGATVVREMVGDGAAGGPPTATECFRQRERVAAVLAQAAPSPAQLATAIWTCGLSWPASDAVRALGDIDALLEHCLLTQCAGDPMLLCAPFQVYPLSLGVAVGKEGDEGDEGDEGKEAWVVGDWDLESLLPSKLAVMPVGVDSLELAIAAPRHRRGAAVLDLCCGGGIQAVVAASTYASHVVAIDVNRRAVRFCAFSVALSGLEDTAVTTVCGDLYDALDEGAVFDVILCNPPFVAVPSAVRHRAASVHAQWALFSDGGEDGADVLRRVMRGAASRLRLGGWMVVVTEIPNVSSAHRCALHNLEILLSCLVTCVLI